MIEIKDIIQEIAGINIQGVSEQHLVRCVNILDKFNAQCRRQGYVLGYNQASATMLKATNTIKLSVEDAANFAIGYKK